MLKDGYNFLSSSIWKPNKWEGKHCEQLKKTTAKTDLVIPDDTKLIPVATPVSEIKMSSYWSHNNRKILLKMIPKSCLEYYKTTHIMVIALGCLILRIDMR